MINVVSHCVKSGLLCCMLLYARKGILIGSIHAPYAPENAFAFGAFVDELSPATVEAFREGDVFCFDDSYRTLRWCWRVIFRWTVR